MAEVREKARKLQEKTRWQLFGNAALAVVIVAISGYGIVRTHALMPRLAFAVALAWTWIGQYFFSPRNVVRKAFGYCWFEQWFRVLPEGDQTPPISFSPCAAVAFRTGGSGNRYLYLGDGWNSERSESIRNCHDAVLHAFCCLDCGVLFSKVTRPEGTTAGSR